jgi:hypothetical protein
LKFHKLHEVFLSLCREEKLHADGQWPFNTARRGYKAVCTWYKAKRYENPIAAAINELGEDKGRITKTAYQAARFPGVKSKGLAFERTELDEHKWDGMYAIGFPVNNKVIEIAEVRRLWALGLIEVRSTAILACRMSFGQRYNREDVTRLLYQAICPPPRYPLTFKNDEYCYHEGAAFPTELPDLHRNGWQSLAMDADVVHTSLTETIKQALNCHVAYERVGIASARACIEGFYRKLTDLATWLPSATGNRPGSPARRNPEHEAKRLHIVAPLANELLDLLCRNYNVTGNGACDGLSPLQKLQELLIKGEVYVNPLGSLGPDKLYMLLPRHSATLNRPVGKGQYGPFYIQLFGARYTSPELAADKALAHLPHWKVDLYVQEDARFAFAVPLADPSRVFRVAVKTAKYADMPHTLAWRRAHAALVTNKVIGDTSTRPNTMIGLLKGLAEIAKTNSAAASLLGAVTDFISRYQAGVTSYVGATQEELEQLLESVARINLEDEEQEREASMGDSLSPLAVEPPESPPKSRPHSGGGIIF